MASSANYDLGDVVRVSAAFTDPNNANAAVDPTAVLLAYKTPDGTVTTYTYGVSTIVRASAGNYYADLTPTAAGIHYYRWYSTGTGQAAEEKSFTVQAPQAA